MGIVEPRKKQLAARVDDFGRRATPLIDVGRIADGDDTIADDGDSFRVWLIFIDGVNLGVGDDRFG